MPSQRSSKETSVKNAMMYRRWLNLMLRLEVPAELADEATKIFQELCEGYTQKSRAYHNLRHIKMCLDELNGFREWYNDYWDWNASFDDVEFALWGHDFVYDSKRSDNEEQSAKIFSERLRVLIGNKDMLDEICKLIKVGTDHGIANRMHSRAERVDPDRIDLIRDIDLTILGQRKRIYGNYERGIRQEYIHVPDDVFRKKRAEILRKFLNCPRIFTASYFYDKYEEQARANLERSIARLTA